MRIAVTGHRPGKLGNEWEGVGYYSEKVRSFLQSIINESLDKQPLTLISGMALGVDTIWAELAIDNNIPFIAAVPCIGQEMKWSLKQQDHYRKIIDHPLCDMRIITASLYNPTVMKIRNEWMVDACDLLVAVWDGSPGGTAHCVEYGKLRKKPIKMMNPNE